MRIACLCGNTLAVADGGTLLSAIRGRGLAVPQAVCCPACGEQIPIDIGVTCERCGRTVRVPGVVTDGAAELLAGRNGG